MKIALCTTTIQVPHVLELYRKLGPDVAFFIAGDLKSPHEDIEKLCDRIGGYVCYLHPEAQKKWKCSELIGWNCIQRRNIAYLEALHWGADVLYSFDDDNLSLSYDHFEWVGFPFRVSFDGLQVSSANGGWFDPGALLIPPAKHRGIPHDADTSYVVSHTINAKVGVAAGMCLGDPDIAAYTRMACRPVVHAVSELLQAGVVVDSATRTVFNSQNTAFIRELASAMFLWPGVGRHDDIFASLVCQRAMKETGHVVHFGKPFVWQQRNEHNLLIDLKNELYGMEMLPQWADVLDNIKWPLDRMSVLSRMRWISAKLGNTAPDTSCAAHEAWLNDCEQVLG